MITRDEELIGFCDTCQAEYEVYSVEGRCGDCGECAEHCSHLEETCQEPLPSNIEIYSARFGGHAVAKCQDCDFTAVFWDCACDFAHDCETN